MQNLHDKITLLPLTGSITLDSILGDYRRRTKEAGIQFDAHIEPLKLNAETDMEWSSLMDKLLSIAITASTECAGEKWIALQIRNQGNLSIVKLEYSKDEKKPAEKKQWIPFVEDIKGDKKDLRLVREIVNKRDGTMEVKDLGDSAIISILMA
jgi:hypothetical protein